MVLLRQLNVTVWILLQEVKTLFLLSIYRRIVWSKHNPLVAAHEPGISTRSSAVHRLREAEREGGERESACHARAPCHIKPLPPKCIRGAKFETDLHLAANPVGSCSRRACRLHHFIFEVLAAPPFASINFTLSIVEFLRARQAASQGLFEVRSLQVSWTVFTGNTPRVH